MSRFTITRDIVALCVAAVFGLKAVDQFLLAASFWDLAIIVAVQLVDDEFQLVDFDRGDDRRAEVLTRGRTCQLKRVFCACSKD